MNQQRKNPNCGNGVQAIRAFHRSHDPYYAGKALHDHDSEPDTIIKEATSESKAVARRIVEDVAARRAAKAGGEETENAGRLAAAHRNLQREWSESLGGSNREGDGQLHDVITVNLRSVVVA